MNFLLLCSALLIFFYAGLSLNVSLTKRRRRKSSQVTEEHLLKAIRAHGNAAEYIPIFVALFVFLSANPPTVFVTAIAVLAVVSRIAHAAGMLLTRTVDTAHPLKFCGAIGTYICLFLLAIVLLQRAF